MHTDKARFGLPPTVVRWLYAHSRRNFWRVADWYEFDDLIQDGLMIAYKCMRRYGEVIPSSDQRVRRIRLNEVDAPHFMALVRTSFHNHIGDLVRRKRRVDDNVVKLADMVTNKSETSALELICPPDESAAELVMFVARMPEHLRKAVLYYFSDEGAKSLRRLRVRLRGANDTVTDKIRAAVGYPEGRDFESELLAYLWESANL